MKIYLDAENKCHTENDGTMQEVLAPEIFYGKCKAFIEGFKYFPLGTVTYGNETFGNGDYSPWRDYNLLLEFQAQYEAQQQTINEYEAALTEIETALGVTSE